MRDYDDMMGLSMYDDGMDGLMSPDMLKDSMIAAGAGAGAIMLASWAVPKIPAPASWTADNQHRFRAGIGILAGVAVGRGLWHYNRDAAMAAIGGVAGIGLAQLIDSFLGGQVLKGTPLGAMPDEESLNANDAALLSAYENGNMGALAALESTNINSAAPAFSGLSDPTITREALMGTGVQMETLGGYQPYLS